MMVCHSSNTALMYTVAEIGTQSTMKRSKKTLHEFSPHKPPKTPKKNRSSSMNEMLKRDTTARAQRTRVGITHVREATNSHQNCHAINKLTRHRRQHAPILENEGIVVMDGMNRRGAKQSISAEIRIKFAMMGSHCKTTREWETSAYTRNIGVRASACNRHIKNKMTVWSHEV
jgi:hypothetical protein